jgi:hypothetical protein
MTNDKIVIGNGLTGESIERFMTDAEQAEHNAFIAKVEAEAQAETQAEAAKAHERSALLAKLGITEEEAALLLGGN